MKQSIVFLLGILFIILIFTALHNHLGSREGFFGGNPFGFITKPINDIMDFFKQIKRFFDSIPKAFDKVGDEFNKIGKFIKIIENVICYLGELFKWMKTATDCIANFFTFLIPCIFVYALQVIIILCFSPLIILCYLVEYAIKKSKKNYEPYIYKYGLDNIRYFSSINTLCYRCNISPPKKGQRDKLNFPVWDV